MAVLMLRDAELRGRHLKPIDWQVRAAVSPFSTGWGGRWWSLLLCYEGIVAFQFPQRRYWAHMLRVGLVAGVAHVTPTVGGDDWPLSERGAVLAPRAMLVPRDALAKVEIRRSRVFWSHVRLYEVDAGCQSFSFIDPRQLRSCAHQFESAFPRVTQRAGWWPAA